MEKPTVKSSAWKDVAETSALHIADNLAADENPTPKDVEFSTKFGLRSLVAHCVSHRSEAGPILHRNLILLEREGSQ